MERKYCELVLKYINAIYIILNIKYKASITFQKLSKEVSSFHFSGYEKLRKWVK